MGITKGSYVAVGLGMMLGAHISPRSRSEIEHADVVFGLVSDAIVELRLQEMRPDMRSLQPYYAEGKRCTRSYREMIEAMLAEVRSGHRVCGAFSTATRAYSPRCRITPSRRRAPRAFPQKCMPAFLRRTACMPISVSIPAPTAASTTKPANCCSISAAWDSSAYLVLWQIGVVGDRTVSRFWTGAAYRQLLLELLADEGYLPGHEVIVYEAATLPISTPRMGRGCRFRPSWTRNSAPRAPLWCLRPDQWSKTRPCWPGSPRSTRHPIELVDIFDRLT